MAELKILIVEDEAIITMDIKQRLENLNYMVMGSVSSGEDALAFVKNESVDLVLMDIMLSGKLDGIKTAERFKKENIPVIFLTAYSDEKTLERSKAVDPYGYLLKPYNSEELKVAIELGIAKHRKKQAPPPPHNRNLLPLTAEVKRKVSVWKGNENLLIDPDKIIYLMVQEGIIKIVSEEGEYSMRSNLSYWEDKLKNHLFFRSHKSFLVNVNKIEKIITVADNLYYLAMKGIEDEVPLTRGKMKELKETLTF